MLHTLTDVQNSTDLFVTLGGINVAVPARTDGRKKHHTETYSACRLLSTLANADRLTFPLSVCRRDPPNDRPDVVMHTGSGQVGIEITEAIPEQFAKLCALREREFPDHWLPVDRFPWGATALTKEEMRTLLSENAITSHGWPAHQAEREWANFMLTVIDTKLRKLAHPGFAKFDQNWLSVYDNVPLRNVHLADAISILKSLMQDRWSYNPSFDTLFIEHDQVIAKITARASEHLILNNLWTEKGQ